MAALVKKPLRMCDCSEGPQSADSVEKQRVAGAESIPDLLLVEDQQTTNRSLRQCPNFGGSSHCPLL